MLHNSNLFGPILFNLCSIYCMVVFYLGCTQLCVLVMKTLRPFKHGLHILQNLDTLPCLLWPQKLLSLISVVLYSDIILLVPHYNWIFDDPNVVTQWFGELQNCWISNIYLGKFCTPSSRYISDSTVYLGNGLTYTIVNNQFLGT